MYFILQETKVLVSTEQPIILSFHAFPGSHKIILTAVNDENSDTCSLWQIDDNMEPEKLIDDVLVGSHFVALSSHNLTVAAVQANSVIIKDLSEGSTHE